MDLHPSYLDAKGLVAVWREGLLALHVLSGNTKGYVNHPQLVRFKSYSDPLAAINAYLHAVVDEAEKRGYSFKREKLAARQEGITIPVTKGQMSYEAEHLLKKTFFKRFSKIYLSSKQKKFFNASIIYYYRW